MRSVHLARGYGQFIDIGSTAIFLQQDPLAENYYNLSPYAYCANNPVNFVDPDGRDFKRKIRGNNITISATIYIKSHDHLSYKSLRQALKFWNERNDEYTTDRGQTYHITYDLSIDDMALLNYKTNTYEVVNSFDKKDRAGATEYKKNMKVLKLYAIYRNNTSIPSTTGAHEIGHILGMYDSEYGIMSESQDENRTDDVTKENIKQMLSSDSGYQDFITSVIMFFRQFKNEK